MNASDPLQKSKCCAKNSKLTLGEMSRQGAMAGRGGGGGAVILSVAEKPSVARELAAIIGGGSANRRNGYSQFNHVFDIPRCEFNGRDDASMHITSVLGHLMGLDFVEPYRKWNACRPVDLFDAPVEKRVSSDPTMKNIERTLIEEARRATVLMLWLDCDLEGENIAFEVINICTRQNRNLDVYRARFSALIPRDVMRTLRHPDRPNQAMSEAVECRQEIDLRLGAAFTRFQTTRIRDRIDGWDASGSSSVISYGPCQFPTLGFVVDRHLQREHFVSENYWYLQCTIEGGDPDSASGKLSCSFKWRRGVVYDRYFCLLALDMCLDSGAVEVIGNVSRPSHRYKPAPLSTIELQKRASTLLRVSSSHATMEAAEALYMRGIISYPRTETDSFPEGFDVRALIAEQCGHAEWGQFAARLLEGFDSPSSPGNMYQKPKDGGHNDQAHPPIHPTKCVPLSDISNETERKVYELVCRHFLACCAKDAVGDNTTLTVKFKPIAPTNAPSSGVEGEVFEASGLMVRERNWLEVYVYEKWYGSKVPTVSVGQALVPSSIVMLEGRTAPPPPISESELISEMDKNGIGTDATIASHIKTIQDRKYAMKDPDNRFIPTKLGIALIEAYNNMGYQLNKPYLRAAMEKDCQRVARGQLTRTEMVQSCLAQMKECFVTCVREAKKLDESVAKYFGGSVGGSSSNARMVQRGFSTCGTCNELMDLNSIDAAQSTSAGGRGASGPASQPVKRFLVCAPCDKSYSLPTRGNIAASENVCPICSFQVLSVSAVDSDRTSHVCPYCFSNPPSPPDAEEADVIDFRCYMCANTSCALSERAQGSQWPVAPCSDAGCDGGEMRLRKSASGYWLSCSKYPTCRARWSLPRAVKTCAVLEPPCPRCQQTSGSSVRHLHITVTRNLTPPHVPPEFDACPVCSSGVWEDLGHHSLTLPRTTRLANLNLAATHASSATGSTLNATTARFQWHSGGSSNGSSNHAGGAGVVSTSASISTVETGPLVSHASGESGGHYMAAAVGGATFTRNKASSRKAAPSGMAGRGGGEGAGPSWGSINNNSSGVGSAAGGGAVLNNRTGPFQTGGGPGEGPSPPCLCGEPSVTRTTTKEGPNKGRQFRCCAKSRDQGCKFFEWMDGDDGGSGGYSSGSMYSGGGAAAGRGGRAGSIAGGRGSGYGGYGGGRGGGRGYPGSGPGDGGVICSRCKQPGHYARQCPNG